MLDFLSNNLEWIILSILSLINIFVSFFRRAKLSSSPSAPPSSGFTDEQLDLIQTRINATILDLYKKLQEKYQEDPVDGNH